MFDDAADTAIRDMEGAGLDVITDGEVRRLDGYVDSYYTVIKNIQPMRSSGRTAPGVRPADPLRRDGQDRAPEGGLGIIDEFKYPRRTPTSRSRRPARGR